MKKTLFLALATFTSILFLTSCDKTEKLTQESWILYTRYTQQNTGDFKHKSVFYKKSEQKLYLKFNTDKTLKIKEDNNKKFATVLWDWKNDSQKDIVFTYGGNSGDFSVFDLTNEMLVLYRYTPDSVFTDTYYHENYKDWDDELIDFFNKEEKNH